MASISDGGSRQAQEKFQYESSRSSRLEQKIQSLESALGAAKQEHSRVAAARDNLLAQTTAQRAAWEEEKRSLAHRHDQAEQSTKAIIADLESTLAKAEQATAPDYCFGPGRELFDDLRRAARNGQVAAAAGGNGSGKTAFLSLDAEG